MNKIILLLLGVTIVLGVFILLLLSQQQPNSLRTQGYYPASTSQPSSPPLSGTNTPVLKFGDAFNDTTCYPNTISDPESPLNETLCGCVCTTTTDQPLCIPTSSSQCTYVAMSKNLSPEECKLKEGDYCTGITPYNPNPQSGTYSMCLFKENIVPPKN